MKNQRVIFHYHKLITAILAGCIYNASAIGQEIINSKSDPIDVLVITGSSDGQSIRKVDASYAITSLSARDIELFSAKSTADLFKMIPGVWAESSGGVAGANIFVRGFPGGGDAPFVTVQLQGVPIYAPSTLSFLENSTLFRLDETIDYMEALRGGPNPLLGSGQPGLTTNFLLKEGQSTTEGTVKYSISDYGLSRIDAVLSGELSDSLYYMIGGYSKRSNGVRDASFNAENGQQFTLNLTKYFDQGKLNFYIRNTDDHGIWYLPTPLNVESADNKYSQIGYLNRQATVYIGQQNLLIKEDFGQGRGWDGFVTGGSLSSSLQNDWHLIDKFSFTKGKANTYGFVPKGAPVSIGMIRDINTPVTGAATGDNYQDHEMAQQIGRWIVKKDIESFTNDLLLSKEFEQTKVTFGLFNSQFSVKDWWGLGNHAYYIVKTGGELLNGIACNTTIEGCGWNYDIDAVGDGQITALYGAYEHQINRVLTLDLGIRNQQHKIQYTVDEGIDGVITKHANYKENQWSWTLGANLSLDHNSGLFVRANRGSKMPYFDDIRDNYTRYNNGENLVKQVSQLELGYKLASQAYSLYVTSFFNEVTGDTFFKKMGGDAQAMTNRAGGIEVDASYYHESGFSLTLNSTLQKTKISNNLANEGNEVQRQPKWQLRFSPSYDFELPNAIYGTIYSSISLVGKRFSNIENTVVLAGYQKMDLGIELNFDEQISVQFTINNLTDEKGLTEGDPRDPTAPNGRYILPSSMKLSLRYSF